MTPVDGYAMSPSERRTRSYIRLNRAQLERLEPLALAHGVSVETLARSLLERLSPKNVAAILARPAPSAAAPLSEHALAERCLSESRNGHRMKHTFKVDGPRAYHWTGYEVLLSEETAHDLLRYATKTFPVLRVRDGKQLWVRLWNSRCTRERLVVCFNDKKERGRAKPTHCHNGHELTPENARFYRGSRYCRVCRRERDREKNGWVATPQEAGTGAVLE